MPASMPLALRHAGKDAPLFEPPTARPGRLTENSMYVVDVVDVCPSAHMWVYTIRIKPPAKPSLDSGRSVMRTAVVMLMIANALLPHLNAGRVDIGTTSSPITLNMGIFTPGSPPN